MPPLWPAQAVKIGTQPLTFSWDVKAPIVSAANATPVYDVRAYGALCNGFDDDSKAINAAVTAANAKPEGGIVAGPKTGVCAIANSASINLLANVTIQGFSIAPTSGTMIVPIFQTNKDSVTCPATLVANITVKDMVISGGASAIAPGASALDIYCATNVTIQNNLIQKIAWEGINFWNSTNSIATKNKFLTIWGDCGLAQGTSSKGITYTNNVCDAQGHATDGGFSANQGGSFTKITENTVKMSGGTSFGIENAGSNNVVIDSNFIEAGYGQHGIRVLYNNYDSFSWTVSNNVIGAPGPGGYCINVTAPNPSHATQENTITANRCNGLATSNGGIYLNGHAMKVASNTVQIPNAGNCILIDATSSNPSSKIDLESNSLVDCGTGIFAANNGYATHLTIGRQVFKGVTRTTNIKR